ncbi:hypothetical protein ACFC3O_00605 [Streptomyces sp. NPDC056007]
MFAAFFVGSTVLGLAGLACVCVRDVPRITGTVAAIVTIAAFGAAILR